MEDEHVAAVVPQLSSRTIPLILDLSRFGVDFAATTTSSSDFGLTIHSSSGEEFSFQHLEAVWWRRPQPFVLNANFQEPEARYIQQENIAFFGGALAAFPEHVRWYNHFHANRNADRKLLQLSVARSCGLLIPDTCVTSSPDEALKFIAHHEKVAFKSFSGLEKVWRPTRMWHSSMESSLHLLAVCPVIFQEYIEGAEDLRVTIIDEEVEAVAFDLSKSRYPHDVRMDTRTPCRLTEISPELLVKLKNFLRHLGLRFGAFDLRLSKDGDLVFFEVNPAGQFLYLDRLAGTQLVRTMAEALSSKRDGNYPTALQAKSKLRPINFGAHSLFAFETPSIESHLF